MSSGSYSSKLLRATLILPTANFPGTASNTLTLVGYRTLAHIEAAANFPNTLSLTIFGMRQADMNAVTILRQLAHPTAVNARAFVQLEASSDGGQSWCQVFEGNFIDAAPDYTDPPNVALKVLAMAAYGEQVPIAAPTSYPGMSPNAPSIVSIAQYLATQMGFTLEPNGVTGSLSTPYFPGTLMDQFKALCQHANLDFYFDGNATLAITPKNQPRQGKAVPVFSASLGNLVGFPTVQRYGIHVDVLFTPALTLGANLQIEGSIVPGANGSWSAYKMEHDLESLQPDGAWFSHCDCTNPVSAEPPP